MKVYIQCVFLAIAVTGCAMTRPADYSSTFLYDHKYIAPIKHEIIITDKTGIQSNDIEFIDIKKSITKEIKRGLGDSNDLDPSKKLKFTYYQCLHDDYYPTKTKELNFFIHFLTIGFFPVGELKKCKTDLDIIDSESNQILKHFSVTIDAKTGGVFFVYASPGATLFYNYDRVTVPARKLLMLYQEDSRSDKYEN